MSHSCVVLFSPIIENYCATMNMKLEVSEEQELKDDSYGPKINQYYKVKNELKKNHILINKIIDNAKEDHDIHWIKL